MADTEEYHLRQSRTPADDEREVEEPKRTKLCVLIGSGILQLPIWGMETNIVFAYVCIITALTNWQALR